MANRDEISRLLNKEKFQTEQPTLIKGRVILASGTFAIPCHTQWPKAYPGRLIQAMQHGSLTFTATLSRVNFQYCPSSNLIFPVHFIFRRRRCACLERERERGPFPHLTVTALLTANGVTSMPLLPPSRRVCRRWVW